MPTDHSAKNPAAASLAGRCVSFSPPQRLGLEVGWYFFYLFLSSPPPPSSFHLPCSMLAPHPFAACKQHTTRNPRFLPRLVCLALLSAFLFAVTFLATLAQAFAVVPETRKIFPLHPLLGEDLRSAPKSKINTVSVWIRVLRRPVLSSLAGFGDRWVVVCDGGGRGKGNNTRSTDLCMHIRPSLFGGALPLMCEDSTLIPTCWRSCGVLT